jgi:hypothetical protein
VHSLAILCIAEVWGKEGVLLLRKGGGFLVRMLLRHSLPRSVADVAACVWCLFSTLGSALRCIKVSHRLQLLLQLLLLLLLLVMLRLLVERLL